MVLSPSSAVALPGASASPSSVAGRSSSSSRRLSLQQLSSCSSLSLLCCLSLSLSAVSSAPPRDRTRRLCCKNCRGLRMAAADDRSGGDLEQLGDEAGLRPHVASADAPNLPLPDHRHRLVARQRSSGRVETAEAEPRSDQAFQAPVILLDDVVQELGLA